ncbi:NADH-quinone oxidoreductase subunit C [Halarcobacter sp.]|uniref:NADH-quinone oxidoreductase subunit C n=1 Tax=Halarcobacter sp. TaxID=2321133 RepID=UPI002AA895C4|nr:NADH-quinone oxidoreductase subunit C [Halarcobacter sp.]
MRKYTPKNDVQNKSYFSDRFYVAPQTPKKEASEDEIYSKDIEALTNKFEISESYIEIDELVIYIKNEDNVDVLTFLKEELEYEMLMEMSAIDYIAQRGGFEIFYEMLSLTKRKRMRVKTFIRQKQPIESVYSVFKMANWAEREMYDMYGVKVVNHPNMKRILMPDDWYDYPLRKTYPLHGDETAQWYEVDKIFGKEAREEIGPEIRDGANVDRYDTERFSRLGHEVPYGTDITDGKEPEHTPLGYQEEGGVRIIKKLHEDDSVTLEERR